MKSFLKLVLVVFLFGSVAFADGDLPNGNKNCTGSSCLVAPQPDEETKTVESEDSILIFVEEYWVSFTEPSKGGMIRRTN